MFGRFFASTFTGSMYGAGANVFAVWGYVIANTSKDSSVELNHRLLASTLGMSESDVSSVIDYLCSEDSNSRNKEAGGRRLIHEGGFQYRVVSHQRYASIKNSEDLREYNREKKRQSRAAKAKSNVKQERFDMSGQPLTPTSTSTSTSSDVLEERHDCGDPYGLTPDDPAELTDDVQRVFEHWKLETNHPRAKLSPERRIRIKARLKDFSADDLCLAISNWRNDPFLAGDNEHGKLYNDLESLLRNTAKVERLMELTEPLSSKALGNNRKGIPSNFQFALKDE